jgi:hypothetical protein
MVAISASYLYSINSLLKEYSILKWNQIYWGPNEAKSGSEYAKMVPKKGNITAHSKGLKDFHPELVNFFLGGLNYTFLNTSFQMKVFPYLALKVRIRILRIVWIWIRIH